MEEWGKLVEDFGLFSADERKILRESCADGEITTDFLTRLAAARRRTYRKALSNARTDERVLVGARLPRQTVQKYRECAAQNGISLYRFALEALEREYARLTE